MMIDVDDDGIRFAAWLAPFLAARSWAHGRAKACAERKHISSLWMSVYEKALADFPVLIGLTKQPAVAQSPSQTRLRIQMRDRPSPI